MHQSQQRRLWIYQRVGKQTMYDISGQREQKPSFSNRFLKITALIKATLEAGMQASLSSALGD